MRERGYYGEFGGAYIPEILVATFDELAEAFGAARADPDFRAEYVALMQSYSCRPTPLTYAENLTRHLGGARVQAQDRHVLPPLRVVAKHKHPRGVARVSGRADRRPRQRDRDDLLDLRLIAASSPNRDTETLDLGR